MTLMNTKLEVSMPGFMKIDYLNQIRKGEKIGGGGCAIIYKGVILDQKLREVSFFSPSFDDNKKKNSQENESNKFKKKKKKSKEIWM